MRSEPPPREDEEDPLRVLGANVVAQAGSVFWQVGETVPDLLWHYTDAPGALGILRGRALWATHALFMNDASELQLANPLLEDALEVARKRLSNNEALDLLTVGLGVMLSRHREDPGIYAVCFCEDGDLLSQWRAYGVSGGGYALGLDGPNMKADATNTYGLSLSPVIYEPDRQRKLAQQLVDRTIGTFAQHLERHPGDFDNAVPVAARSFSFLAQAFAYQIKDSAFREEQEWRLIYARDPKGFVESPAREFRSGARGLVPFFSIAMGVPNPGLRPLRVDLALGHLPVREVRIGPTAHPEIATLAMRYLLGDLRLKEVTVSPSGIPLRA